MDNVIKSLVCERLKYNYPLQKTKLQHGVCRKRRNGFLYGENVGGEGGGPPLQKSLFMRYARQFFQRGVACQHTT